MIPKKIHYCWFGPNPLPESVVRCLKTWREQLPDYDMYLWNEENSPMQETFVRQAYSAKKYAFVSDYVRFWALDQYGGIYLDTDMFVLKSFNDLLKNDIFFGWETDQKTNLSCGIIGTIPRHPFIRNIIRHYKGLDFSIGSIPGLVIPRIVSECYNNFEQKEEITLFPFDYFYPFPYEEKEAVHRFMKYRTENTYAIHLWNVSWGTFKDKLRDRILYHLKKLWKKVK
jgi:mannosyltransferase OCH1-like enzyme